MKSMDYLTDEVYAAFEQEFIKARGKLSPEETELFDDFIINSMSHDGVKKLLVAFVEAEKKIEVDHTEVTTDIFINVIRQVLSTYEHSVDRAVKCRQEILMLLDKYNLKTVGIAGSTILSAYIDIIERSLDENERVEFAIEQLNIALRELEQPNDKQLPLFS